MLINGVDLVEILMRCICHMYLVIWLLDYTIDDQEGVLEIVVLYAMYYIYSIV